MKSYRSVLNDHVTFTMLTSEERIKYYLNQWSDTSCSNPACEYAQRNYLDENPKKFPTVNLYSDEMYVENIYCVDFSSYEQKAITDKINLMAKMGVGDNLYLYFHEFISQMERAKTHLTTHKLEISRGAIDSTETPRLSQLPVKFGDDKRNINLPILRKTRLAGTDESVILFKMGGWRHWVGLPNVVLADTVPWEEKKGMAVWRGSSTGGCAYPKQIYLDPKDDPNQHYCPRAQIIRRIPWYDEKFGDILDVGVTSYVQNVEPLWGYKSEMSRLEQMSHKKLIVVEGNDVSTSGKWAMTTTSAILTTKPTVSSWLMEELLVPYIHYIPVADDFSDLETQVQWCLDNDEKCEQIGLAGRCFMEPFLDNESEEEIIVEILKAAETHNSNFDLCEDLQSRRSTIDD